MVQIIPRAHPSFGEQVASGLSRGFEQGADFAKQVIPDMLARKAKTSYAQQVMEQLKNAPGYENLSPIQKLALQQEISGGIGSGSAKSLINAEREALSTQRINDLLGGFDGQQMSSDTSGQQQGEMRPQQKPTMSGSKLAQVPEDKLRAMLVDKTLAPLAQSELDRRKEEREISNIPRKEYYKHAAKENAEFISDIGKIERDLPNTSLALAGIEDSLGNAGKWAAARDYIADHTGYEGARSAAGAELDSFIKNYFLGDLTSIKGGRPNVFIEKQIRDAYQKAGRDPISNQKTLIGMKMKEEINRLLVDTARKMESQYIDFEGALPANFKSKVSESIRDRVGEIEKKAVDTLHHMSKIEEQRNKLFRKSVKPGEVLMMDENGKPFAVPKKEVSAYREMNYIPLGGK